MASSLASLIDLNTHPIDDPAFLRSCKVQLDAQGFLTLLNFLLPQTLEVLVQEARAAEDQAYFSASTHNVYLTPPDPNLLWADQLTTRF